MSSTTTSEGLLLFNELNQKQASGSVLDKSADYIIRFNFQPPNGKKLKEAGNDYRERVTGSYRLVIARLTSAGLEYEVRRVGPTRLFIFVICPRERLRQQYDRSRVQDWISGVNSAAFIEQDANMNEQLMADATSFDTISTATRLRLVHDIITGPISEGCAAISVEEDPFVEAIYPLHDRKFNEALLKKWATKWFITQDDLLEIRNHFGENIAYYFEFLQFYFIWLSAPSLVGLLVYFYDAGFTVYYAMFNVLWSLLFVEMWRRREQELATWWSVRNCSKLERRRSGFQPDRIIVDAVTGEPTPYYPSWKRWMRRLVTFPILAAIGAVFFIVVGAIFAIEVFVYEYYQGPFKDIVYYTPLIAYSVAIWYFSDAYTAIAKWLNNFENYETVLQHTRHYTYKIFLINFAVGYMFIFYTAWIHIPLNAEIASLLAYLTGWPIKPQPAGVEKLQERVIYYVLTAQVINFFTEVAVPWLLRSATDGAQKVKNAIKDKSEEILDTNEQNREFLKRIIKEDELAEYEIYEDYAEMVTQFGHVVLFSCAWPLAPMLSFINNWIELRSDAFKICTHTKRQVPTRVESIGPWVDNLLFLSWLSSVANALLVYQFGDYQIVDGDYHRLYLPLLLVILAEHAYLGCSWLVRAILSDIPSWATTIVRRQEHELKCRWLEKMNVNVKPVTPGATDSMHAAAALQVDDLGVQEIANAFKND